MTWGPVASKRWPIRKGTAMLPRLPPTRKMLVILPKSQVSLGQHHEGGVGVGR